MFEIVTYGDSPVTLDDLKTHLKIPTTFTTLDAYFTKLLKACTLYGEKYTAREFRANTWKYLADEFPYQAFVLRRSPVASVTSITYLQSDNVTVGTVTASDYYLINKQQHAEIWRDDDTDWPVDVSTRKQSVIVEFVTELYAKASDTIEQAIKEHATMMYYNRGECEDCSASAVKEGAKRYGIDKYYDQFRVSRV